WNDFDSSIRGEVANLDAWREPKLVDLLGRQHGSLAGEECDPDPAIVGCGGKVVEIESVGEVLQRVRVQNLLQRDGVRYQTLQGPPHKVQLVRHHPLPQSAVLYDHGRDCYLQCELFLSCVETRSKGLTSHWLPRPPRFIALVQIINFISTIII